MPDDTYFDAATPPSPPRWVPELTPKQLRLLAGVCEALNAVEDELSNGDVGLSFMGVLTVAFEDGNWAREAGGSDTSGSGHHAILRVGHLQPLDLACWGFVPTDPLDMNTETRWGQWQWLPWPEDRIEALVDAVRALCPPLRPGQHKFKSLKIEGVEQVDPRREALEAALEALDKSAYQPCARRSHIVRGDHTGEDGRDCDHRYTDATEPGTCRDASGSDAGAEVPSGAGTPAGP